VILTVLRLSCAAVILLLIAPGQGRMVLGAGNGALSSIPKVGSEPVRRTDARRTRARIEKAEICTPCSSQATGVNHRGPGKQGRDVRNLPCHPADYVDPRVRRNLNAALIDLKRVGIKPKITSAWRSSSDQEAMYRCSYNDRCRRVHPGLYRALPPGQSAHEAGLALDISGVAAGRRGAKHVTPQGRRIVQVMSKHGFKWRYGLRDPVHFEADPTEHGYRNLQQAIHVTQTTCEARILARRGQENKGPPARTHSPADPAILKRRASVTYTQAGATERRGILMVRKRS
jgi:hypothetical protein